VLARAIAASRFSPGRSAQIQSYGFLGIGIASILAIIGSGYLSLYSWRHNFWLAALFGLILILWASRALQSAPATHTKARQFDIKALTKASFIHPTLCHSFTYGLMYSYIGLFPFLLIHYMDERNPSHVGLYSALMIALYMGGALLNSQMVAAKTPHRMALLGLGLQCVGGTLLAFGSTTPLFFLALAIFNVSLGITLPATSASAMDSTASSAGSASSALGLSYRLIGSLLSTLVTSLPLSGGNNLGIAIILLSLASLWLYRKTYQVSLQRL
jgi:MFS family permease